MDYDCVVCLREGTEKKEFTLMWDSSYLCLECFSKSNEESLDAFRKRQAILSRVDDEDEDELYEVQKCPQCRQFITESRRWVRTAQMCRRCHRGLRDGIRPAGAWFQDELGRMIKATENPSQPLFAYGEGNLPRSRVIPWRLGNEAAERAMSNQQKRCWEAVQQFRPMAIKIFNGDDDAISDVGYRTIGRCALTYNTNTDAKFSTFVFAALTREFLRWREQKQQLFQQNSPLCVDIPARNTYSCVEARDQLLSLGLTEFELWLLEQKLLHKRKLIDIAWELKVTTGAVRKQLQRVSRLLYLED